MKLTYKTANNTFTSNFTPSKYLGVDFNTYSMTPEAVESLYDIKHVGECPFKGEVFTGKKDNDEYFVTELVVFFGMFEDIEE